jgi:hypothetical protein
MTTTGHTIRSSARCSMIVLFLGVVAGAIPSSARGQARSDTTRVSRPPTTQIERPTAEMQQQLDAMTPMMGQMMQSMMRGTLAVLVQRETADQLATFTANYFDALVQKGFTREEALRIVMAHGIPTLPTGP